MDPHIVILQDVTLCFQLVLQVNGVLVINKLDDRLPAGGIIDKVSEPWSVNNC